MTHSHLHYGMVCRPKLTHTVSGDTYVIQETPETALIAVIDGLGSGVDAAYAANQAKEQVQIWAHAPLTDILQVCHEHLRSTRGAVMAIMRLDWAAASMTYAGVGNIGIQVASAAHDIKPISRNGIVGHRLPKIQEFSYPYTPGDLFALYSDGVSSRFSLSNYSHHPWETDLQTLAEQIVADFGKDQDDVALILAQEPTDFGEE
ncbi:MAG: SpoIIE family protein phosphatase [Chloroflexi bacterium]|nr:SpoIIE family protein phosphatase [Chloroflexota bacterium]MBU1750208.1 SpoIIE family protein phosphatase [Chloroflexota bacterium]MBU1877374.1 SpoIIE family protein phosphatase [Chloroflexota bacterium]